MQQRRYVINLPVVNGEKSALPDMRGNAPDAVVWVQILGTFIATYSLEMSVDGVTWVTANAQFYDVGAGAFLAGASTAKKLLKFVGNPPHLRANCTAFTSAVDPAELPRLEILGLA